jgi:hypothetical protein
MVRRLSGPAGLYRNRKLRYYGQNVLSIVHPAWSTSALSANCPAFADEMRTDAGSVRRGRGPHGQPGLAHASPSVPAEYVS